MTLTPAERQKRYRQTRAKANNGEGDRRLSAWVSTESMLALKRLANLKNMTQRDVLEMLILKADKEKLRSLQDDDRGFQAYLDGALRRNEKK